MPVIGTTACQLLPKKAPFSSKQPEIQSAPLEILQAVKDFVRAHGKEMQAENVNAQVAAQVGVGLARASCAHVSDPSLLLDFAGGCCTMCRAALPVPADSFPAVQ